MVAKVPPAKVRSHVAFPASSARSEYSCPLACSRRSAVSVPASLTVPSTGDTMARGSASTGRVPSRSARVKNSLKLG